MKRRGLPAGLLVFILSFIGTILPLPLDFKEKGPNFLVKDTRAQAGISSESLNTILLMKG